MANQFEKSDEAEHRKHEQDKHEHEKHEVEKHREAEQRKREQEQKEHGVTSAQSDRPSSVHRKRHEDEDEEEPVVTHPSSEHGTPHDVSEQPTLEQRVAHLERRVDQLEKPPHALSPAAKHDGHSLSPEQVAQVEQLMAEHLQRTIGHSGEPAYGTSIDEPAG